MPSMPKVPYIVGDDDDMSEAEDRAQRLVNSSDQSDEILEQTDSPSSNLSDHLSEDCETDEENSSADDEEDWSHNISYIVVTPKHEPEDFITDSKYEADCPNESEIDHDQFAQPMDVNHDVAPEESIIDFDTSSKSEAQSSTVGNSPQKDIDHTCSSMDSTSDLSSMQVVIDKGDSSVDKLFESNNAQFDDAFMLDFIEFSPPPRRLSLRSASRTVAVKAEVVPVSKPKGRRVRQSKPRAKRPKAEATAMRVVKRTRIVARRAKSPIKKPLAKVARPIDVTNYFMHISSMLVRQRVNLLPFLHMRKRIDQLVTEAISRTDWENNQNPIL